MVYESRTGIEPGVYPEAEPESEYLSTSSFEADTDTSFEYIDRALGQETD